MKRTLYKISFSLLALTLLLASCGKKLEIAPKNNASDVDAVKSSDDVKALLVGAYDGLGSGNLYGGNVLRDAELLGDDGEVFWDGTFVAPDEIFRKSMLTNNDQVEATWVSAYRTINICNNVLANLNVVVAADKNKVEGEAKFIRASVYFELVRLYGKTWVDGDPNNNPGVPLVLTPTKTIDASAEVARSTVSQVYTQVIADLTDAETKLPSANGFFATKWAAAAQLSRVYLMQNNYPAAANAANRVIASNQFGLVDDFAAQFNNGSGATSDEDIFAMQITSQDGVNNMNTFFGAIGAGGRGDIPVEDKHFLQYEPNDIRADFFVDEGGRIFTAKWLNQFGNVTVLRLAEMYLTRAEANLRAGTNTGATPLADVNRIRTRAGLANLLSVSINDVLKERRVELAFEGQLIHDLKRTKRSVGTLPFNSPRIIFPIPQRETDVNKKLTQNDGYQ